MMLFKNDHVTEGRWGGAACHGEDIPLTRRRTTDTDTTDNDSSPRHTSVTSVSESSRRHRTWHK